MWSKSLQSSVCIFGYILETKYRDLSIFWFFFPHFWELKTLKNTSFSIFDFKFLFLANFRQWKKCCSPLRSLPGTQQLKLPSSSSRDSESVVLRSWFSNVCSVRVGSVVSVIQDLWCNEAFPFFLKEPLCIFLHVRSRATLFEDRAKIAVQFWYKARYLFHFSLVNPGVEQY
jgi:hypothetical protein